MTQDEKQQDSVPDDKMIDRRYMARGQLNHTLLVQLIPLLGTVAAIALIFHRPIGLLEIGLLAGMSTLCSGLGANVGYHRYFTHNSFETSRTMRSVICILGLMSGLGPVVWWVVIHRRHHENSDQEGDPHSPIFQRESFIARVGGLWHAHFGWMVCHDVPNPLHYAPDLLRDDRIMKLNKMYYLWALMGQMIPAIIGGIITWSWWGVLSGILWGGMVRIFVAQQIMYCINSITHTFGSRSYDTRDSSTNNLLLAIPSFGESWHNNHHAFPTSARHGLKWWQVDLGFMMIWIMERLRLVWKVKRIDGHRSRRKVVRNIDGHRS